MENITHKRGPKGEWLDSKGKPITFMDCVAALHTGITRLSWELIFGEKKDDPERRRIIERDMEVLLIMEENFREAVTRQKNEQEQQRRQAMRIPGRRRQ